MVCTPLALESTLSVYWPLLTLNGNSDTPFSLAAAALEAVPVLTGTEDTGFDFTVFTGDLVSHDSENQLSR